MFSLGESEAFAFVEVDVSDEIGFVDSILAFFDVSGMGSESSGRLGGIVFDDLEMTKCVTGIVNVKELITR